MKVLCDLSLTWRCLLTCPRSQIPGCLPPKPVLLPTKELHLSVYTCLGVSTHTFTVGMASYGQRDFADGIELRVWSWEIIPDHLCGLNVVTRILVRRRWASGEPASNAEADWRDAGAPRS